MPPKSSRNSKRLKQTTLFDNPASSPIIKNKSTNQQRVPVRESPSASTRTWDGPNVSDAESSDDIGGIRFAPVQNPSEIVSEDQDITSLPKTRKRQRPRIDSESPSEQNVNIFLGNTSLKTQPSDSDDVEESRPQKRGRLHRRKSSADKVSDSEEDIDSLADELDEEQILNSRLRKRDKRSTYQKNLEKLKRRKLKLKDADEGEEEEEEGVETMKLFKGSKPTSKRGGISDDDNDSSNSSDFIVEDDNVVKLPAEFSMETHQDISYQFKKIFQFFVHVAVAPQKSRATFMQTQLQDMEYFSVPLQMTRRKISGLRDSLVASSVWSPEYKRNLERYPNFELVPLDFAAPFCDACRLGGRLSKLVARLTGPSYSRLGFEQVPNDVDADEDHQKEVHLGRFCAKRTKVYHQFSHWERSLFTSISREIDELRNSTTTTGYHRVAFFHGQEPPKDLNDADALCEWLDQRNIVEIEWQKLKTMMESARHLEVHGRGGENED